MIHEGIQEFQSAQLHEASIEISHGDHLTVCLLGDLLGMFARIVLEEDGHNGRTGMIDNLTEETTLHNGRQRQQMRHCSPSHLARDCDPIRISSKILDEMLHELQSQKYVQETRIAGYLIGLGR